MRTCFVPWLACLLLVSCGTGGSASMDLGPADDPGRPDADVPHDLVAPDLGTPDPGEHDPGIDDAAPDAPPDAGPDARPPDPGFADTTREDTGDDASTDTSDAIECPPVTCGLACPHGFRQGADGCPVCVCRECAQDGDCGDHPLGTCPALACSEGGTCVCDCSTVDPAVYQCPGGLIVPRCGCTAIGHACLDHPEYQCPTVCTPGQAVILPCPDDANVHWCTCRGPSCVPQCRGVADDRKPGWYDPCEDALLLQAPCDGCTPLCNHIGTRSEGWYDACSGALIAYAQCAPELDCIQDPMQHCADDRCVLGQAGDFPCPGGGTVPLCACDVPEAACTPQCRAATSDDPEGWYHGCTGKLLEKRACAGCTVSCEAVGSKSEGWYSSCDGLIAYAMCGTGTWVCAREPPIDACTESAACVGEGSLFNPAEDGPWPDCCPGLATIDQLAWESGGCIVPEFPVRACTLCGDGACTPPEDPCDCPEDCLAAPGRKPAVPPVLHATSCGFPPGTHARIPIQ